MDAKVNKDTDLDVIVVGAGFSGLHILHELVKRNVQGASVRRRRRAGRDVG